MFGCCAAPVDVSRRRARAVNTGAAPALLPSECLGKYKVYETLGAGSSSVVKKAVYADGRSVALKLLRMRKATAEAEFDHEFRVLRHVKAHAHDLSHIVTLLDTYPVPDEAGKPVRCTVLEHAPGENLAAIAMRRRLDECTARRVFGAVVSALVELQALDIAHRDVKLDNIVVDNAKCSVKLVDFGLAKMHASNSTQALADVRKESVGTQQYAAPEVRNGVCRDAYAADVYSLGVALFAAVTQRLPDTSSAAAAAAAEEHFAMSVPVFLTLSPELQDLIVTLTARHAADRPALADVRSHRWFKCMELPRTASGSSVFSSFSYIGSSTDSL
eukprot:TRINITY_DN2206_c0_g1_i1.p1 TRINITY_DN2206_c0_g1~~TRINITY_DN2206_c0_g1_i1.p1  ORF type:complete len:330 (+),score=66.34 TRINITY_DN2206_c0_g1_i1:50-1039(+)